MVGICRPLDLPALGPGAGGIIHVPIEGFGQCQALRHLQTERIDVGDEDQHPGKMLAASRNAEFSALLDRIDGVAPGIGKPNDLGFGLLGLEQE